MISSKPGKKEEQHNMLVTVTATTPSLILSNASSLRPQPFLTRLNRTRHARSETTSSAQEEAISQLNSRLVASKQVSLESILQDLRNSAGRPYACPSMLIEVLCTRYHQTIPTVRIVTDTTWDPRMVHLNHMTTHMKCLETLSSGTLLLIPLGTSPSLKRKIYQLTQPSSVYEAGPDRDDYWVPIQGLDVNTPGRNFPTVMFISTCRIIYRGLSADWIFHVTDPYPRRKDTWWNRDPRARPLTCIDWSEVCTADEECSPTHERHPERGSEYEFTREALNKSTTFSSSLAKRWSLRTA
jgi:hypothetical protein